MKYFIITGTSRGLGQAITEQLLKEDHTLFCISRKQNTELKNMANSLGINLYYFSCDLQKVEEVEKVMEKIFTTIDFSQADGIYLINNAGIIAPIKRIDKASSQEIGVNVQVNLVAPMLLITHFIRHTLDFATEKVVINVSSGAAKKPRFGWSTYCSTKAGLDMFTASVALEQRDQPHPITLIGFSPGVMDTDMQSNIRQAVKEDFVDVEKFIGYSEQGLLRTPEFVANQLLTLLFTNDLENGRIYDIKELIE